MKHIHLLSLLVFSLACVVTSPSQPSTAPATIESTPEPIILASTAAPFPTSRFQFDDGQTNIVYEFTSKLCEGKWVNSVDANALPCPGNLENAGKGYIGLLSGSDQGLASDFPMILARPASDGAGGIFGIFPPFRVEFRDEFRASLTCRSSRPCEVQFNLAYYDEQGKYIEPFPVIKYQQGNPVINLIQPLNSLADKTVQFVLVVRSLGNPAAAWALWVAPRILRP